MYIPAHFRPPDEQAVRQLLTEHGAADLITMTEQGLVASMLPLVYVEPGDCEPVRPLGALFGHVARNNDQWRLPVIGDAMMIVRGEDAYVTPSWYPAKAEHGRVVPTRNYITAHVYGELIVHDDPIWVERHVRRLTAKHEARLPAPWSVDDAPAQYLQGQLRAIVGLELRISRIEAKFKLGQNRSADDIRGVVKGLGEQGRSSLAAQAANASRGKLIGD